MPADKMTKETEFTKEELQLGNIHLKGTEFGSQNPLIAIYLKLSHLSQKKLFTEIVTCSAKVVVKKMQNNLKVH